MVGPAAIVDDAQRDCGTAAGGLWRDAIFTHPTMSKGLNELLASVPMTRRRIDNRSRLSMSDARFDMQEHNGK